MPTHVTFTPPAIIDLDRALKDAKAAGDAEGHEQLLALYGDYLVDRLQRRSAKWLAKYLAVRTWRSDGDGENKRAVSKTIDVPCVAYALVAFEDRTELVVLGFCYRYPVSEEAWWRDVILPRLRLYS